MATDIKTSLAGLRKAHAGKLLEYDIEGHGPVLLKRPTRGDFKRFIDQVSNDKHSKASSMEALVKSCRLHPDAGTFDAVLDDMPGLLLQAGADLQELAGVDSGRIAKKG